MEDHNQQSGSVTPRRQSKSEQEQGNVNSLSAKNDETNTPDQTGSMASDGPNSQNEVRGNVDLDDIGIERDENNQAAENPESSLDADERSGGSVL